MYTPIHVEKFLYILSLPITRENITKLEIEQEFRDKYGLFLETGIPHFVQQNHVYAGKASQISYSA